MKKPATQKPRGPKRACSAPPKSNNPSSSRSRKKKKTEQDFAPQIISPVKIVSRDFLGIQLENILHQSNDLVVSLGLDHNVRTINPAACELLGYSQSQIIGKNWFDRFVTPSMRTSAIQSFHKLISGENETMGYVVIPVINQREEEYLVEWQGIALKDSESILRGILLCGRDITQQKQAEKELIQREWDMTLAQKMARLGSWVYNRTTHEIRMSNGTHLIFETHPHTFEGTYKAFLKLIHPDDRHRVDASHQETFRTGKGHRVEYRIPLSDGTDRIIYEESKVFLDDLDNPLKVRGIVQDITERKKVEEALRHSERELSIAQKIGKMGNWVYDTDKDELWWSDQVYRIFGLRPEQSKASYQAFLNAVHPEDREFVDRINKKILKNQKNYSMDHRIVLPDGSVRTVHQECQTYYDKQGHPQKLRGIVQDITERKQAEEKLKTYQEQLLQAEKLSSIGKLSASIAHEINNPLFGIRNVLERTQMCVPMDESDKRFIEMAISETDRIAKLTRRLNTFFSPAQEHKERVQINWILEEIVLLVQKELTDRHIRLLTRYNERLPEVSVVPDQIKQVALNLLQNAMDAVSETGGEIILETNQRGSHLILTVKDNGTGMSGDTLKNIFEPFFTTKPREEGTGLGLWVTQGIVQWHGGTLEVASQYGKGTTFTVSLPLD